MHNELQTDLTEACQNLLLRICGHDAPGRHSALNATILGEWGLAAWRPREPTKDDLRRSALTPSDFGREEAKRILAQRGA